MAVDPQAVSVFVVATAYRGGKKREVHGALLANEIGRFVHEWSLSLHVAHTALRVQVTRVIQCAFGVWYREPDYSSQLISRSLCAACFVVAQVSLDATLHVPVV